MEQQTSSSFASLIPLLIITLLFAWINFKLAKTRGLNPWAYTLISVIPGVWIFVAIYLLHLPHKKILERLEKLEISKNQVESPRRTA